MHYDQPSNTTDAVSYALQEAMPQRRGLGGSRSKSELNKQAKQSRTADKDKDKVRLYGNSEADETHGRVRYMMRDLREIKKNEQQYDGKSGTGRR